ncbi:MAG: glycosyltransferase family 4 protein [Candidatus Omnitrophota bacterium]
MKILVVHNQYLFPGGEDQIVTSETDLLKRMGHEVIVYTRANEEARKKPVRALIEGLLGSRKTYQDLAALIKEHRPDVAHIHNPFFMMTASAYEACFDCSVPVVQSLHNYRFLCANGLLFYKGKVCDKCLSGNYRQAVFSRCVHGSLLKTAVFKGVLRVYRKRKILQKISRFIAPSKFCKELYCSYAGLDQAKVIVKPHFVEDHGYSQEPGEYALYVGAIREYKGVEILLRAWQSVKSIPLKLVGAIPSGNIFSEELMKQENVEFLGELSFKETLAVMRKASFVIVPSLCYETFNRVIIEAYALGKTVIASNIGAIRERVADGETGLLFETGDSDDLARKIGELKANPDRLKVFSDKARRVYERFYTPQRNYEQLMTVYHQATGM